MLSRCDNANNDRRRAIGAQSQHLLRDRPARRHDGANSRVLLRRHALPVALAAHVDGQPQPALLASQLFEAADHIAYRLPVVFAGFDRADTQVPIEYLAASMRKAWSAAAPQLGLSTILGPDPVDGHLRSEPACPLSTGLRLAGVSVHGQSADSR
jgi:hypothetical protein